MLNILKDFENASPRLNPLFYKPLECQVIIISYQLVVCTRKFMVANLLKAAESVTFDILIF